MALSTFNVADIIQSFGDSDKINVEVTGISDTCYGMVVGSDKSFADWLNQHRGPYNFQVVDGDPIKIIRRSVNGSFTIDFNINQSECIPSSQGQPSIQFTRVNPESLPGLTELTYSDVNRVFTSTTQSAKHRQTKQYQRSALNTVAAFGNPTATHTRVLQSCSVDFILDADTARALAFDYHYRTWAQATTCQFEHNDLRIEASDTIQVTSDSGIFTLIVQQSTITKRRTNIINATVVQSSTGFSTVAGKITIPGGVPDAYSTFADDDFAAWLLSI